MGENIATGKPSIRASSIVMKEVGTQRLALQYKGIATGKHSIRTSVIVIWVRNYR